MAWVSWTLPATAAILQATFLCPLPFSPLSSSVFDFCCWRHPSSFTDQIGPVLTKKGGGRIQTSQRLLPSMSSLLLKFFSVTFCFQNHLLNIILLSHFDHFCPASADILTSFLFSEQNFSEVLVLSDILDLSLSADWIVVVLPDDPLHFLSDHKSRLNFKGH